MRGVALRTTVCSDRRRWVCGGFRGGLVIPVSFVVVSDPFHFVAVQFASVSTYFGCGFVLFLWWSPHHRFSPLLFLNLLLFLFDLIFGGGGGGVSTLPMMVLVLLGFTVVFCFHAGFYFTRVLFPLWFMRVFIFDWLE